MRTWASLATGILLLGLSLPVAAANTPPPGPGPTPDPGPNPLPVAAYLPEVVITSPAQGTAILGHTVTVEGTVNVFPPSYAELTVNGQPVSVGIGGTFSTQVTFDWKAGPDFEAPPEGALLPIVAEVWDERLAKTPTQAARDRVTVIRGKGVHVKAEEFEAIEIRVRRALFDEAFADAVSFVQNEYVSTSQCPDSGNPECSSIDYDYVATGKVKDRGHDGFGEYGPKLILHQGYGEVRFDFDVDLDLSVDYGPGDCTADYDAWNGQIHWYFALDSYNGNDINVYGAGIHNPPTYSSLQVTIDDFHLDWASCYGLYPGTALDKVVAATGSIKTTLWRKITEIAEDMDVFQKIEDALANVRIEDALDDALSEIGADVKADIGLTLDPEGLLIDVDLGLGEQSDAAYELGKNDFIPYHFTTLGMRDAHPALPCGSQGCWYTGPTTGLDYDIGMSMSPYFFNWYLRGLAVRGDLDSISYQIANPFDPSQQMPILAGLLGAVMLPGLAGEAVPTDELALEVVATASPYLSGRLITPEPSHWHFALADPGFSVIGSSNDITATPGGDIPPLRPGNSIRDGISLVEIVKPLFIQKIPEYELIIPDLRIRIRDSGFVKGYCHADDGVYLELAVDARLGLSLDRKGSALEVSVLAPTEDDIAIQVVRAPCGFFPEVLDDPDYLNGAIYLPALVLEEFASVVQDLEVPGPLEISVDIGGQQMAMNDFLVHGQPEDLRPFVIFLGDPPLQAQSGSGNPNWWAFLNELAGAKTRARLDTNALRDALDAVARNGLLRFDPEPFSDLMQRAAKDPGAVSPEEWEQLLLGLEETLPVPVPRPTLPDVDRGPAVVGDPDLDGDGRVAPRDFFEAFRPCMGARIAAQPSCRGADLDSDGVVGATDFFQVMRPGLGGLDTRVVPPKGVEQTTFDPREPFFPEDVRAPAPTR